jgi:hypothetical protein
VLPGFSRGSKTEDRVLVCTSDCSAVMFFLQSVSCIDHSQNFIGLLSNQTILVTIFECQGFA